MTITLKKPVKGLDLTDEPAFLKSATSTPIDDPVLKYASQIENKTLVEIEEIIKNLGDEREFNFFKLGGAIARAQALFNESKPEFAGYENFQKFVTAVHGDYSKAMRAAQTYKKLVQLGVPWAWFEEIGWTKVLALLNVLTKDNVKEWVAKAKEMNHASLTAVVKSKKQKSELGTEQGPKTITAKTFHLHEDQKEVVNAALEKIKEESGTTVDTVALEYMAQNYLGAGVQFKDWDQAITYAAKHQKDVPLFFQKVITRLEALFPHYELTVEIKWKDAAAAA